uniref:Uncharacterized protein n=1 Tax=Myoviridae sp. ctPVE25 TaxID=2826649 RepID=A0A8S5QZK6_9CAUD|nr:MAG TPA: hypothetical protein [Myoviridae sp. ctPVE25]
MNNKFYLGQNVSSLDVYELVGPITGIHLTVDDTLSYQSGPGDGYVFEITCPWGTQAMADSLYQKLGGKSYQGYQASGAVLDISSELGDGVTVDGVYVPLVSQSLSFSSEVFSDIGAPGEEEVDHEYPYLSPQDRALKRKVALGALYYGTRITRNKGLEIVKTDGETEKARVILNADTLAFYNDDGEEALYFDAAAGKYKFRGIINVNDKFLVDKDGNVTLGGNVVFTGESSFTLVKYSTDKETWVDEWDNAWENTSTEVWAKYSYNAGTTWTSPILVQAKNGERGPAGSSASVTFANIKAALMRANATESTFITADEFGSPNIYGGKIYGAEIYAGSGDSDEGYAAMTANGFDVVSADALHKIGLGLETIGSIDYPYLILGAGSGDTGADNGVVKKFTTGIWIGDSSAIGVANSGQITGTGIFVSFGSNTIYQVKNGSMSEIGSGSGGEVTVRAVWG